MSALVPARTILEKDVNIVLSLREIDELNNIIVVQCLQSPHLVLQCMDKEIFRERLVFGEVDLIDEMLLLNHLAGHFFTSFFYQRPNKLLQSCPAPKLCPLSSIWSQSL